MVYYVEYNALQRAAGLWGSHMVAYGLFFYGATAGLWGLI